MKSYSIHIGVNKVDPIHYQGWNGALLCCENDALFYKDLAQKSSFTQTVHLLSSDPNNLPTSDNFIRLMKDSSENLQNGDLLFVSYSGHGGSVPDENNEEEDMVDESWCFFDRQFLDDELFENFRRFKPGVKIVVVSDSCHSGTVVKDIPSDIESEKEKQQDEYFKKMNYRSRYAPRKVSFETYRAFRDIYINVAKRPIVLQGDIKASVLLLAACQDNEKAAEWQDYGLFTNSFKKTFEGNHHVPNYEKLFHKIKEGMPSIQNPNLFSYGNGADLLKQEKPFYNISKN